MDCPSTAELTYLRPMIGMTGDDLLRLSQKHGVSQQQIQQCVQNKDLFSEVSPFWYSATWTGSTSAITQQVLALNNDPLMQTLGFSLLCAVYGALLVWVLGAPATSWRARAASSSSTRPTTSPRSAPGATTASPRS